MPDKELQNWTMAKNGFWAHWQKWKNFPQKNLRWAGNWLKNDYCGECRLCCGPQGNDEPFPMPLLPRQINAETARQFYLLDANTACIGAEGCKSDSPAGCRLSITEKPVACNLFPLVLIHGKLYLYQNCPAALFTPVAEFMLLGKQTALMLAGFSLDELRHLSIEMDCTLLAAKYIDLHIQIFDGQGKKMLLE